MYNLLNPCLIPSPGVFDENDQAGYLQDAVREADKGLLIDPGMVQFRERLCADIK